MARKSITFRGPYFLHNWSLHLITFSSPLFLLLSVVPKPYHKNCQEFVRSDKKMAEFCQIWQKMSGICQIWQKMAEFCQIWQKNVRNSSDLTKNGRILSDHGKKMAEILSEMAFWCTLMSQNLYRILSDSGQILSGTSVRVKLDFRASSVSVAEWLTRMFE